tara:strand:- start:1625 stop:1867 length:243 start_codon:yes stop_codon:yes gene_type:complete
LQEPSYFLYIVGVDKPGPAQWLKAGDCGVGRFDGVGAGIIDAPYGTMLVVPAEYIFKETRSRYPAPHTIKRCILRYYGKL